MKKNDWQIVLMLIALAVLIAVFKDNSKNKSYFIKDDDKKKPEKKKCWRVNKAGNGMEWYYCTKSKI